MESKILFVYVTCANKAESEQIGRSCVEKSLAACANIFPEISSVYKWKGEIQADSESVVLLKTDANHFEALRDYVLGIHSYECPCITAFAAEQGFEPYFVWINQQLSL